MKKTISKKETIYLTSITLVGIIFYIFKDELFKVEWFNKYSPVTDDSQSFSFDPDDLTAIGCTDPIAENYDPNANTDVDSGAKKCFYNYGCCSSSADNYDAQHDSCEQPDNDSMLCDWGDGVGQGGEPTNTGWSNWWAFSDSRLKENVRKIGKSPDGIPIYTFNYNGKKEKYSGVMAQDLLELGYKDSVQIIDGYYVVDYNTIDVEMKKINNG